MAETTTRLCGFCLTQVPLAGLDGTQCADYDACRARADAKFLYPLAEDRAGAALTAYAARQGAVPARRRAAAPDLPELAGPARGNAAVAAQPVRRDAWPAQYVRDFPELVSA